MGVEDDRYLDVEDILEEQIEFYGSGGLEGVDGDTEIKITTFRNWDAVIEALEAVHIKSPRDKRVAEALIEEIESHIDGYPIITYDEGIFCLEMLQRHKEDLYEDVQNTQWSLSSALARGPEWEEQVKDAREERRKDPRRPAEAEIKGYLESHGEYPRTAVSMARSIVDRLEDRELLVDELEE